MMNIHLVIESLPEREVHDCEVHPGCLAQFHVTTRTAHVAKTCLHGLSNVVATYRIQQVHRTAAAQVSAEFWEG